MRTLASTAGALRRRSVLTRLGAVVVGASAMTLLQQKKALAAPTPRGCYGYPGCDGGCGSSTAASGGCCWYWTDTSQCRTYRCCDKYNLSPNPCICRYTAGNFC